MKTHDPVHSPQRYTAGAIECIDALEAASTPAEFRAYCKLAAIKYLWRYERKGGAEDIAKAQWYLARLQATLAKETEPCPPAPATSATTTKSTKPRKPAATSAGRTRQTRNANGRGAKR